MGKVAGLAGAAAVAWFILFSPWTAGRVNFWLVMAVAAGSLAAASLYLQGPDRRQLYAFRPAHLWVGLGSAAVLYLVFFLGHAVSTRVLPFAAPEIGEVYGTRAQAAPWVIAPLLFFWVGPAEEIFWRGLVQHRLATRYGEAAGYLTASLVYAGVHIWAFNLMLFTAALICGLFWGFLFLKYRSLWPGVISHAVWDVAIFVLFPLQ